MIEVKLPPEAGSVPLKQFAHSIILKLLNDDARSQGVGRAPWSCGTGTPQTTSSQSYASPALLMTTSAINLGQSGSKSSPLDACASP